MSLAETDLLAIVHVRLEDARALLAAGRPDGAWYLCGYAVEVALKACICRTLGWAGYPATRKEFEGYSNFKTHDLEILLHLSGRETFVRTTFPTEWLVVAGWDPEVRYQPVGHTTPADAKTMIDATEVIVRTL